jgi:hypothetical protein
MGRSGALLKDLFLMCVGVALGGCAARAADTTPSPACAVGDSARVRNVLYFGRNRPDGGTVTDEEWRAFVSQVLTPRFPAGLTIVSALGQWQGKSATVEQERSEVVTIFLSENEAARRSVDEVAAEYKRRFQQEAVLREQTPTCVRFE